MNVKKYWLLCNFHSAQRDSDNMYCHCTKLITVTTKPHTVYVDFMQKKGASKGTEYKEEGEEEEGNWGEGEGEDEGKGQDRGEGTTYLKVWLVKTQFNKQFGTPNEGLWIRHLFKGILF